MGGLINKAEDGFSPPRNMVSAWKLWLKRDISLPVVSLNLLGAGSLILQVSQYLYILSILRSVGGYVPFARSPEEIDRGF